MNPKLLFISWIHFFDNFHYIHPVQSHTTVEQNDKHVHVYLFRMNEGQMRTSLVDVSTVDIHSHIHDNGPTVDTETSDSTIVFSIGSVYSIRRKQLNREKNQIN